MTIPANLAEAIARVEWIDDGPYGLGKYDSLRDEYLHGMSLDGWSSERSGEVDAPTGWFALMINEAQDIAEIADAFGPPVRGIIGNFILSESSQGFAYVAVYDTADEARLAFAALNVEYGEWLDASDV